MKTHISSVCKSAHHHLRNIGSIRKYLSQDLCVKLIHAFITSRLDYGNALLYGLPDMQTLQPQPILNTAARIVSFRSIYEHIQPVLKSLHWLPVKQRITFKILLLTFHAINKSGPSYLSDLITLYKPPCSLRSEDRFLLVESKTSRSYGDRAFSVAGPRLWNALPESLRKEDSLNSFKHQLKTFLFKVAYGS